MTTKKLSVVKEKKKVAILGTVPHKMQAPFKDEDFEIWAIAHACLGDPLPKVDRIFEVHPWDEVIKWKSDLAWKLHPNIPVYLREARKDVKGSLAFPFEELAKKYNIFDDRKEVLFTNSISEMIVLAIDEGFEEIHVYGVDMAQDDEYRDQRPSCEYFIGLARGAGIKVYVPEKSDLLHTNWLYPFEDDAPFKIKLRERDQWLGQQSGMLWNQEQSTRDQRMQMIGARDNMKYIEMAWSVCRQEMSVKMKKEHGELSLFKEPEIKDVTPVNLNQEQEKLK